MTKKVLFLIAIVSVVTILGCTIPIGGLNGTNGLQISQPNETANETGGQSNETTNETQNGTEQPSLLYEEYLCNSPEDCPIGFCMRCPPDTQFLKCNESRNYFYCDFPASTNYSYCSTTGDICKGGFEGDEYIINPYSYPYRTQRYFDPPVIEELIKEGLTKWKNLVLKNISEEYFREHVDIYEISASVYNSTILAMDIHYNFSFDWARLRRNNFGLCDFVDDRIYIKELRNGQWAWMNDSEIERLFYENRWYGPYPVADQLHSWPTDYELDSILSEEETVSLIRHCIGDSEVKDDSILSSLGIDIVTVTSKETSDNRNDIHWEGSFQLIVPFETSSGQPCTEGVIWTTTRARVDLVSGASYCYSFEGPCFVS